MLEIEETLSLTNRDVKKPQSMNKGVLDLLYLSWIVHIGTGYGYSPQASSTTCLMQLGSAASRVFIG